MIESVLVELRQILAGNVPSLSKSGALFLLKDIPPWQGPSKDLEASGRDNDVGPKSYVVSN